MGNKGILENKGVQGIKILGSKREEYKIWNEKFKNIRSQAKEGGRKVLEWVVEKNKVVEEIAEAEFTGKFGQVYGTWAA